MPGVFINYRGEDSQLAGALIYNALADEFGEENVFLDSRSIRIGDDFAEVLLRRLRLSSVLLVIVGSRWLVEGDESGMPRISDDDDWVRREIREGFAFGLRVIPVLIDNARLPRDSELPADVAELGRHQYLHLRRRYAKDDLALLIANLADVDGALAAVSYQRRSRAHDLPHQLPAAPNHFVGRDDELSRLTAALTRIESDSVAIFTIDGTAGVGKTGLALRWAHRMRQRFPDGDLYVDLQGYGPGEPLDSSAVLAGFLRALGVDASSVPQAANDRAAMFRTLLYGRRLLLLLDNARSEDHVRPLLPGTSGCAVIVTSRQSMAGLVARDGAYRVDVDVLSHDDAIDLLQSLIGDRVETEGEAASLLAQCCGGLPLALRIAAEQAAARPRQTLSEIVSGLSTVDGTLDLLDSGSDPFSAVRAVFSWSYELLPDRVARLFRLCGAQPGTAIDVYAAAALADMPITETREALRTLSRSHLVNELSVYRIDIHDLLRAYASELRARSDEAYDWHSALGGLFAYYLETTAAAMALMVPHERDRVAGATQDSPVGRSLDDHQQALNWLETERTNLVMCVSYAASSGLPEWRSFLCQLASALFRFLETRAYDDDAIVVHTHALEVARLLADPVIYGRALTNLGVVCLRVDRFTDALRLLADAIIVGTEAEDWNTVGRALNGRGATLNQLGRHDEAREYHERALTLAGGDRMAQQSHAWANLGVTLQRMGLFVEALSNYGRALTEFVKERNLTGEGRTLNNLGSIHGILGDFAAAGDYYEQAVVVARRGANRRIEVAALNGLGETAFANGDPAAALEYHRLALATAREFHERRLTRAHAGLARAYRELGDEETSASHWQQAWAASAGTPRTTESEAIEAELIALGLDPYAGD